MPPGRSSGGGRGGGGRGRGRGRGGGGGRRPRGRGGRSSGRGTALPSSITGRGGGGAKGGDPRKRNGGDGRGAGYEFDDGGGASDRHKYDDEAGDSDDGPGPEDSDFEDEEVDEDAAFDSADEARYGELMDTILQRRSGKQGGSSDEEGDESEDESDDDGGEGGGMSVMDMLAANEAAELAQKNGVVAGTGKGKGKAKGGGGVEESSRTAEVSSAESSEGDAMDEDVSDEEALEDDSDDDDEDEDERHARLMGFVGGLGDQAAAAQRAAEDRRSSQLLKEGEFNSASGGLAAGRGGGARKGAVTMETLMGSLQKSKGFAAVKKQVAAFSGKSGAPAAPVSKTAELRAEREMAYDNRKNDMGKWVAPVQANRKAETLDFAPTVKTNLSNAALASKMEATTDMEKEVEMLLTAGGASEAGLAENEMEELKSKAYTVEEVKERQAELSKMRALMFYHERKQHHMNKIKSKVYRKIKKRQRDRAGDAQQEEEGELGEVAARKRAEERMSLRHKNTSKWVKNALRAKGGAGKDDRKAIAEQLKIGQELRAKMGGVDGNSSEDSSSSEEEEGGGGASSGKKRRSALKDTDREELERIGEDEDGIPMSGKGAALMKMAFMQKAMDKQRERAREEASVVLRELEEAADVDADADGSDDDETVRRNKRSKKRAGMAGGAGGKTEDAGVASKETRAEATAEVAKALPAGALQSSAVSMDARVRSSVASPITIDLGDGSGPVLSSAEDKVETLNMSKKKSTGGGGIGGEQERSKKRRKAGEDGGDADRGHEEVEEENDDQQDDESNPWLAPTPRRSKSRRRAPNGEVLLDVRKAAATALSAFGGSSAGGKEGPSASGDATDDDVEHEGGGDAEDAETDSVGPLSSGKKKNKNKKNKNNSPPDEQAEQEQGGGRKKRKRRKTGGGGGAGDANGREGASGAGTNGEGAEARAATEKAAGGGNKKAKTASERSGKSGVKKSGEGYTATPKLAGLSNDELVRRAFAAPDFESEFKDSKDDEIEGELAKGREKLPGTLAGWGAWAGDGAPAPRGPTKHQVLAKNAQVKKEEAIKKARKDDRLPKVVLNEKRQKRSAKYMVSEVPYPFTSREQYERSLRQPIGGEWNTSQSVRAMTRPAVVVRAGVAVAPMKLGKIHRDNARERSAVKEAKGATQAQGKKRGGAGRRRGDKKAQ